MGSQITPENRNEYESKQTDGFKEQYLRDVIVKRKVIEDQEDKSSEEIESEVLKFNEDQVSEDELNILAKRFARFQSNKENKHYKAWLAGETYFRYKGRSFPVLTKRFLEQSQSIKDIVKVEQDESDSINRQPTAEGEASIGLPPDNEGGDDQALRSDSNSE